ncbi:formate-dependent phosphoribosylglycinamide formyltransferase [Corynebacterium doosanense]|uniref:Phosphoribosylglycinamide formyltransferase n=1 Tax=Corynebacterium doosanense CAU 212 = DSM 45436 TaxID=558173 RepID=A0A097IIE4_9CORY|nr:formate-dependent phosphoribosylglycinamide formyltransferase [Corynebacterium doosanense]AIT61905.1 phosphoribosylglycinamide formyltransferase [Corynebacterium doosanense CAU 212 = DSM 45436]
MTFPLAPTDRIGTPMSGNATTVLLLGSGEIGKELTIAFQRLGLEVHAVDRKSDGPAHQVAQYQYVADVSDPEQVRSLVRRVRPDFVVPEIEGTAVEVLREIEEAGSAVVVPTARACELTAGRESLRITAAEELGLPTTAYEVVTTLEEFAAAFEELGFPCVAKPAESSGGRRHVRVDSAEQIERAWRSVREPGAEDSVIVERFVDFDDEITILAVRSVDPATGELATWFCEPIGHRHEDGVLAESWQPLHLSEAARDNARSVAARISNALGGRGVYGVEMFVAGDDVYFSSVSSRPHDTGTVTLATQRFSQFDLHARAILGLPIDVTLTSPGAAANLVAEKSSRIVSYSGFAECLAVPETDVRIYGKPTAHAGRQMGVVLTTAETVEQARENAREAASHLTVETR